MTDLTIARAAALAVTDPGRLRADLSECSRDELRALERESRQRWRTPQWLLDLLVADGWAGPWDIDLWADDDGSNRIRGTRMWRGPGCARDQVWPGPEALTPGSRAFANPPFNMWGEAVSEAVAHVGWFMFRELTLVGPCDMSTEAVRELEAMGSECRPGRVHALRVPVPGRWSFDAPAELRYIMAGRGVAGGFDAPSRTSGVWVLRRVPEIRRGGER
jgi:hypothetical protein